MEEGMELIALINDCKQYSPDGFEDCPRILDIDENTTIGDLIKWHNKEFAVRKWNAETKKYDLLDPDFFSQIHIIKKSTK
jgi:hypothetical protein